MDRSFGSLIKHLFGCAWSVHGAHVGQRTFKYSVKFHMWECFAGRGFGCLSFNAEKMVKIYKHSFSKSVKKIFGENHKYWLLQEDNAPKHRSRLNSTWKAENAIIKIDWPSISPDRNLIQNV